MLRLLAAAVAMLGLCAGVSSCGSVSCPKGQEFGIVYSYWVPTITYPGHYTVEVEYVNKTEEESETWVPGYTIYGHISYVYGCKTAGDR